MQLPVLPHHKLQAFGVAKEMLLAVRSANIRDAGLRDQGAPAQTGRRKWVSKERRKQVPPQEVLVPWEVEPCGVEGDLDVEA
jgi:hypothetical protein